MHFSDFQKMTLLDTCLSGDIQPFIHEMTGNVWDLQSFYLKKRLENLCLPTSLMDFFIKSAGYAPSHKKVIKLCTIPPGKFSYE